MLAIYGFSFILAWNLHVCAILYDTVSSELSTAITGELMMPVFYRTFYRSKQAFIAVVATMAK